MLPNFLIVGAAKSGTTSLFEWLCQHPEICRPTIKEPGYFSDGGPYYVSNDQEYLNMFDNNCSGKLTGEASTFYLFDKDAPKRIKKLLPNIKIIILLRNPADRAYSLWGHNYYQSLQEKLQFEEALKMEERRIQSKSFNENWEYSPGMYQYFKSGLYYEQVKRYFNIFGEEKVKVYIFEEFIKKPDVVFKEILEFIGVDSNFKPKLEKENIGTTYKSKFLHNILLNSPLYKFYFSLPSKIKLKLYKILKFIYYLNISNKHRKKMDIKIRNKLLDKYLDDIKKLEKLLNRDLSIWYKEDDSISE